MSAPRFFIASDAAPLAAYTVVTLPDAVARHAVLALRLRDGEPLVLFDGRGGEYDATLVVVGKAVHAHVHAHRAAEREVPHACWLVQAIVAPDVMDAIVRQAVELGVAGIVPLVTERTQRVPAERLDKRVARWQQIAVAACEQSGRNRVPEVRSPISLEAWLRESAPHRHAAVMLHPATDATLAVIASASRPSAVVVGPEGGFTEAEVTQAREAHVSLARFGGAVLRADTAALAALAILHASAA